MGIIADEPVTGPAGRLILTAIHGSTKSTIERDDDAFFGCCGWLDGGRPDVNTVQHTGYASLSEFINAAVEEKVTGLERQYNAGNAWEPRAAGEIPKGKPRISGRVLAAARATAPVSTIKEFAVPQQPHQALVEIVEKLRSELDEIQVFYKEDGKSVMVVTRNHRDDVDDFRYHSYQQPWLPIEVFTYNYVRWEQQDDIELPAEYQ
jgi:Centromere-binding protein ParB C-terminal